MSKSFTDLNGFEDWFRMKLVEEFQRRINYIKSKWNNLTILNRGQLIDFLGNNLLTKYKLLFINKQYNEFYLIIKDQFELCYELINKWSSSKLETNNDKNELGLQLYNLIKNYSRKLLLESYSL